MNGDPICECTSGQRTAGRCTVPCPPDWIPGYEPPTPPLVDWEIALVTPRPQRIQRKRTKGWRLPEGAVYVGRPSQWGNPFAVERVDCSHGGMCWAVADSARIWSEHADSQTSARQQAVDLFALHIGPMGNYEWDDEKLADLRRSLAGHDLACWCPLDAPCHADVLLELANGRRP